MRASSDLLFYSAPIAKFVLMQPRRVICDSLPKSSSEDISGNEEELF